MISSVFGELSFNLMSKFHSTPFDRAGRTINNSSDDLIDFAITYIGTGKPCTESWSKFILERLEGASSGRRPRERRGSERSSYAAEAPEMKLATGI